MHRNIEKLRQRISKLDGIVFNLGAAISAFARDNTNEFLIRKMCNDLDLEDFNIAVATNNQGAGVFWRTTKHIRWFGPALRGMPIEWVKKIANEDTKTFFGFLQVSYRLPGNRRLQSGTTHMKTALELLLISTAIRTGYA